MKQVLIISVLLAIVSGLHGFQYRDCGSKVGNFSKIDITGCDTTQSRCILRRNTNASITIDFTLKQDCSEVITVVHGVILDVPVPFPLQNPNACVDSGLHCPLKKDIAYEYKAILPVLGKYPRVTVDVKWELQNENKEDIICILIPARIQ